MSPKSVPKRCSKCGRRVRHDVGRYGYNTETGRPQYWRFAACESVSLDGYWGFVLGSFGAKRAGPEGHFATRLERADHAQGGCMPGCLPGCLFSALVVVVAATLPVVRLLRTRSRR